MALLEAAETIAGKSIVLVLSSLGAGGAEGVVAQLANHWLRCGARVTVIAFDHPRDPVFHHFDHGVSLVRLGLPPVGGRLAALPRTLARLHRLRAAVRSAEPSCVVSFLTKINVTVLIACGGLGIPIIVSERNHPGRGGGSRLWQWGRRQLYPRAAAVVLQTEASRRALPSAIAQRGVVIPNPVEQHDPQGESKCSRTLVAVGRLESQKGFDLLLAAFARIAPLHADWRLIIWGEGRLRGALEQQVRQLGLGEQVSLPGVTARPGGWRDGASALVSSSRHEGFSNAVAEALAAGIPVIAFDCEFGVAEILGDGQFGILIPAEDIEALAAGLDRLLADDALRRELMARGLERSRDFAPNTVLSRWDRLLVANHP